MNSGCCQVMALCRQFLAFVSKDSHLASKNAMSQNFYIVLNDPVFEEINAILQKSFAYGVELTSCVIFKACLDMFNCLQKDLQFC